MVFDRNDRVVIVGGTYKGQNGTYLAPAGFRGLSAGVQVYLDSRDHRTLRTASLQAIGHRRTSPARAVPASRASTTGRRPVSPEPNSLQDLVEEARDIQRRVADLIVRLEAVDVSGRS
jgi:hypothetical protein